MPAEIDFWTRYSSLCLKAKACPLQSVFKRLKGTEFCCVVDVIRCENWPFLLAALKDDECLTSVQFNSKLCTAANQNEIESERKRKSGLRFPIPYGCSEKNVTDICRCVANVLPNSKALTVLKLENLYLKEEDALILEKTFKDSRLENFSLSGCRFQEYAFEIICRGIQQSNIHWFDITSCDLNASDVSYVCKIIKGHNHRRSNEMFQHTLRYQLPVFDDMKGLNRITLNNNDIGDAGLEMLANCFSEDFWIKALDLQKCNIGNDGAKAILNVTKRNAGLHLIDLRLNDIDESIVDRITLQLALNSMGKVLKYNLGSLWKPLKSIKIPNHKVYLKKKVLKPSPPKRNSLLKKEPISIATKTKCDKLSTEEASSQTTLNYDKELRKAKTVVSKYNILLHQLKKYKRENKLLRQEVENFAVQDNYILIDHETFAEVKSTFEKFKTFLDIMKKNGLWDCVAILEANENAGHILKPLISDAHIKCLNILKKDPSCERISQSDSNESLNGFVKETKHIKKVLDHPHHQKRELQDKTIYKNSNEHKLFFSKVLPPEMNYVKKPIPSDKALAQKVFKEVMENYTSSSKSSEPAKSFTQPLEIHLHKKNRVSPNSTLKHILLESTNKMVQMKTSVYDCVGDSNNSVPRVTNHGTISPHKPSTSSYFQNNKSKNSSNNIDLEKATENIVSKVLLSASKSLSDGASTIPKSTEIESDSSTYHTLPNFPNKANPLSENNSIPEFPSKKESIYSSDSTAKYSPSTDNQTSSESELPKSPRGSIPKEESHKKVGNSRSSSSKHSTLVAKPDILKKTSVVKHTSSEYENSKSPRGSKTKERSHKKVSHSGSSSSKHSTLAAKPDILKKTSVAKQTSSASSVSSYSSKNSYKEKGSSQHSSDEEIGSEKSYLESVSEASTDKDIKSLSEEVISSDSSKKDSQKSLNTNLKAKEQAQNESTAPTAEMHSKFVKKTASGDSVKSSETNMVLKKGMAQASGEKPEESDVPSLSDITTVSSRSLNTDSVMGQLSD